MAWYRRLPGVRPTLDYAHVTAQRDRFLSAWDSISYAPTYTFGSAIHLRDYLYTVAPVPG